MFVEIFSLCDAATSENGKLNILGAFDTIWVRKFPTVYPHCTAAVRVRFSAIENGAHPVEVRFINADGRNVLPPAGGSIQVACTSEHRSVSTNLILNVQSLNLQAPGEFSLELSIDGVNMLSLPLFIRSMPQAGG